MWFINLLLLELSLLGSDVVKGQSPVTVSTGKDPNSDLLAAQCRTRCISRLQTQGETQMVRNVLAKVTNYLSTCINDEQCQQCIKPCNQPFVDCDSACKPPAPQVCMDSCQALLQTYAEERSSGSCPSPRERYGLQVGCEDECNVDTDCSRGRDKCCPDGCARSCLEPVHYHHGAPSIPGSINVKERPNRASFSLSWDAADNNATSVVLYVIQSRYSIGRHPSHQHATQWLHTAQTTRPSHIVRNVSTGRWYFFRVAAVSVNGSHGFSHQTSPIRLSKAPTEPGRPLNVTVAEQITSGNRVSITINWMAPKKTDLPIARYKVFWSKMIVDDSGEMIAVREQKKVVNSDRKEFTINDLEIDNNYLIQVQAMSQFRDTRLKGEREGIHVSTFVTSHASRQVNPTDRMPFIVRSTPPPYNNMRFESPYFENGLLKVNVSWDDPLVPPDCYYTSLIDWTPVACILTSIDGTHSKPLSATTPDKWYEVYDLRFNCHYRVKVSPVCEDGLMGKAIVMTLETPECRDVEIRGMIRPDCPSRAPQVPEEPVNLADSYFIVQTNITAIITWDKPYSDANITSYRITWGQVLKDNSHQLVLDQNTAVTKVISHTLKKFNIPNLNQNTGYIVRLQALSDIGPGLMSSISFTTPSFQQPRGPPYSVKNSNREVQGPVNIPSPLSDDNRSHPKRSGDSTIILPEQISTPVVSNKSSSSSYSIYLYLLLNIYMLRQFR